MLAERRIDRGIRGLTAGVLLLVGFESSNTQPVIPTETTSLPAASQTVEFVNPEIKAIFDEVYNKHGVKLSTQAERDNPNIYQETQIIATTIDKIPAVGYLINGGIGIHKDRLFYGRGRFGAIPFYDKDWGGFNLIIGYDFDPDSKEGAQNQIGRETHKELVEWIIVHEAGHLFTNRIQYDPSLFSVNHPVHKTFAQLIGYEVRMMSFKRTETESENLPVWSMVSPARPFVRTGHVGNIEETFADYFAASILYPQILSDKERRYFDIILTGLRNNPKSFTEEIRSDPQFLLQ